MSTARKVPEHEPIPAKPRIDAERADILAKINARFEKTLRYLGR